MSWTTLTLAEIARDGVFTDGDWVESKDQDPNGTVRLTQLADVGAGEFRNRSNRWMREDQAARLNCTFLQPDDVMIARMPEPIGRACLSPENVGAAVTAVDVAILRIARPDILPRFVMWAINTPSFHARVEALQSGTTRKRISRKNLARLTLDIPPLDEQRRIVAILDDHLSRLDAADQLLDSSAKRARTLLRTALWGATHLAGETKQLAEIADVKLGRQRSPKNHSGADMVPYLRAANVDWNRLRLDDVKSMNFTAAERDTFTLLDGDILLTEASGSPGEVGKSVVYRGQPPPEVCFQNTVLRVRCFDANPDFVQRYLLAEAYAGRFVAESRGVGIHHLGRTRLSSWPISLPDRHTQERAVEAADEVLSAVKRVEAELNLAGTRGQSLRRSLLSAAFQSTDFTNSKINSVWAGDSFRRSRNRMVGSFRRRVPG